MVGFPQMGAGRALATTGTRWMIAAIMLIFVAALTPGFRRSPPAAKGKRVFSSKSNRHRHFQHRRMGRFQRHLHHRHLGLHRGQRCLWLFGAGDGRVLHVLSRHRHGHIRARGRLSGGGNQEEVKNGRLGVAATMVMGVILGVLLVSLAGPISRLLVREDAIIGGIAIAPAIAALLWLAAAATVFDGLQATASFCAAGAGHDWLPSAIHLSSFFVVMIPVCYWLAIPLGAVQRGAGRAFVGVFVAGTAQFILLEWKAARPGVERAA